MFACDGDTIIDDDRAGVFIGCLTRPRSRFLTSALELEGRMRAGDAGLVAVCIAPGGTSGV